MQKIKFNNCFDEFLNGGFELGIINNVYGPSGCGKTLISMIATIKTIEAGKRVIYIDTEGGFSIERFKQLSKDYKEILDKIIFLKPNTFTEQKKVFEMLRNCFTISGTQKNPPNSSSELKEIINEDIGLIIVDSISMLYRLELGKNEKVYNINRELGLQVSFLNEIARKEKIGVLLTSHVYSDFDNKDSVKMVGGDFLKYASKCVIEIQNMEKGLRKAIMKRHRSIKEDKELMFKIINEGINELEK
jgi:DNA repair protein RadB